MPVQPAVLRLYGSIASNNPAPVDSVMNTAAVPAGNLSNSGNQNAQQEQRDDDATTDIFQYVDFSGLETTQDLHHPAPPPAMSAPRSEQLSSSITLPSIGQPGGPPIPVGERVTHPESFSHLLPPGTRLGGRWLTTEERANLVSREGSTLRRRRSSHEEPSAPASLLTARGGDPPSGQRRRRLDREGAFVSAGYDHPDLHPTPPLPQAPPLLNQDERVMMNDFLAHQGAGLQLGDRALPPPPDALHDSSSVIDSTPITTPLASPRFRPQSWLSSAPSPEAASQAPPQSDFGRVHHATYSNPRPPRILTSTYIPTVPANRQRRRYGSVNIAIEEAQEAARQRAAQIQILRDRLQSLLLHLGRLDRAAGGAIVRLPGTYQEQVAVQIAIREAFQRPWPMGREAQFTYWYGRGWMDVAHFFDEVAWAFRDMGRQI